MTTAIKHVGICNFDVGSGEEDEDRVVFCGAPAVCELWFDLDLVPEARFCAEHRPVIVECDK